MLLDSDLYGSFTNLPGSKALKLKYTHIKRRTGPTLPLKLASSIDRRVLFLVGDVWLTTNCMILWITVLTTGVISRFQHSQASMPGGSFLDLCSTRSYLGNESAPSLDRVSQSNKETAVRLHCSLYRPYLIRVRSYCSLDKRLLWWVV